MSEPLQLLTGVRIVAFTQFLLGPAAVQYLADMGAEVIKIEEPKGGPPERRWSGAGSFVNGVSTFFLLAHRNVQSVSLDLKSEKGREAALRLCAGADVVVSNMRPGVMDRLGLGTATLRAQKPDLVFACASGYGSNSPFKHLPGQDLLLQATTGLAAVTGAAKGPPTAAGAAVVDQHAASLLAMGILGALYHRARTGEGQELEVTMVQAALDLQAEPFLYHLNGAVVERPRTAIASSFHEAPYGFYAVQDGHIALSLSPVRLVSDTLGDPPELAPYLDPAVALSARNEIHDALATLLSGFTKVALLELFRERGIWCAPVNDYDAVMQDPMIQFLDPVQELEHPDAGTVRVLKHPITFSSGTVAVRHLQPRLGEHTDDVLTALGYDQSDLAQMRAEGVL